MRYFHKFFLSITLILTAALAVMEYSCVAFSLNHSFRPVSYTHLDVYKRQALACAAKWSALYEL